MNKTFKSIAVASAVAGVCSMMSGCVVTAAPDVEYYVGDSDYYGAIPMVSGYRPMTWNLTPVYIGSNPGVAPIYLRVPDHHRHDWIQFCHYYNACQVPVFFVRDDWYRHTYTPAFRHHHPGPVPGSYMHRPHHRPGPGTEHFPPPKPGPSFGGKYHKPMPPSFSKPTPPSFSKPMPPSLSKPMPPSLSKPIPKPLPAFPKPTSPSLTKPIPPSLGTPIPKPKPSFPKLETSKPLTPSFSKAPSVTKPLTPPITKPLTPSITKPVSPSFSKTTYPKAYEVKKPYATYKEHKLHKFAK